ncbi:hypothetical protein PMAYCL1PPCAC_03352 [Pristionchus mayeri]|uniref:Copper transport protein n=1 Tax=Pristionchus mayeri TaxID=1317129 RepID=A0AAN4Z260_9BILA|nr:hypothetical protein PMAYCL1PPCAC_03352 [Pristionchus mayeri]
MADHAGHAAAAAAGHAHSVVATTVATTLANATAAIANLGADVVNSDVAHDVSEFLAALAPPAHGEHAAGGGGAHAAHDHGAHHGERGGMQSGGGDHAMAGHHMMKMWFHGGVDEVILFDWWRTDSCLSLLISCVIIFAMGALYEGVKWFRVYLQMSRERVKMDTTNCHGEYDTPSTGGNGCSKGDHVPLRDVTEAENGFGPTATPPVARRGIRIASGRDGAFSVFRLVEAALYSLQLVLAYWLMLIVMTYNTWLTIAVIAGAAFGHWLFAILNILSPSGDRHDSFTTDACH